MGQCVYMLSWVRVFITLLWGLAVPPNIFFTYGKLWVPFGAAPNGTQSLEASAYHSASFQVQRCRTVA
jgi:hypothetical protein